MRFAYYDPDADIAWLPTGESHDVVSERVPGGLRDYDRDTRRASRSRCGMPANVCPETSSTRCPPPRPPTAQRPERPTSLVVRPDSSLVYASITLPV